MRTDGAIQMLSVAMMPRLISIVLYAMSARFMTSASTGLEEQHCTLSNVEVHKVFLLIRREGPIVDAYHAVPYAIVLP